MKDRSHSVSRTRLSVALAGLAFAFALGGCSGQNSTSGSAGGAPQSGAEGASSGATGPAAAGGRRRMAHILLGLGLSDEQKTQIRDIMSSARKDSANADPATRRANYKAAFAKIDTVLTPDQRAKMHAQMARQRPDRESSASSPAPS